jgi:DHA3 family macrolide efflux protein-like MFS transporter
MSYSQILTNRAFRNLWLGQAISQLGDSFFYVAFMFMVQKVTGSYAMVGFVGVCETVPYLLFSLYAGVVADRIDRKRIMLWSDLLSGVVLCMLAALVWVLGKPPVWSLLATPFLLSSVRSFFMPAKNAAIPALVPPSELLTANALSSMTQNIAPVLSLSLSAGVLSLLYATSPALFLICAVLVNSLSFFGSALFVWRLPKIVPDRDSVHTSHPWADLKDGLRYIRSRRVLVVLLSLSTALSFAISPYFVVYVAANTEWLGGKPQTLASCELAFFAGMVVASLYVGKLKFDKPGKGFIFGCATVGLTVVATAFSPNFGLFLVWSVAAGLALPFASIPVASWMQATVPDAFRGRVNSLYAMLQMGAQPLGLGLGGMLVAHAGISLAFIVMGGGMAVAALAGLFDREFRNLEMPSETKDSTVYCTLVEIRLNGFVSLTKLLAGGSSTRGLRRFLCVWAWDDARNLQGARYANTCRLSGPNGAMKRRENWLTYSAAKPIWSSGLQAATTPDTPS